MKRTGRRPGAPETRETIVAAARRRFATHGYDGSSLRAIAADAGVDPALLIHYFGTKEELFVAATGMPLRRSDLFGDLDTEDAEVVLDAVARGYLRVIDSDRSRNAVLALVRSAVSNEQAADMLREFITVELLDRIAALSDEPDAALRAALVGAQLIGVAVLRHVVRVEALAQASPEEIRARVVPALLQHLH